MRQVNVHRPRVIDHKVYIGADRRQLVSNVDEAVPERKLLTRLGEVAAGTRHKRLAEQVRHADNRVVVETGKIKLANKESHIANTLFALVVPRIHPVQREGQAVAGRILHGHGNVRAFALTFGVHHSGIWSKTG